MPPALRLLRPKQWTKGLLVFGALLFSKTYLDPVKCERAILAFWAIAFVSSAIYVLNDLFDIERDRRHPVKRTRPLASGEVSKQTAIVLIAVFGSAGLALTAYLGTPTMEVVGAYIGLQVLYNGGLKKQPVADVFCLSLGFVLRAALGAASISVGLSGWILFCTGALALLLGFGKRRHEWVLQGDDRATSRESLAGYNRTTLEGLLLMAAASAAMSYGIYSVESPTARQYPSLILTSLFVFYGIYRYVYLLLAQDEGGEPENLLFKDRHLVLSVTLFLVTAVLAMSGFRLPFIEAPGVTR
jgi:4-hydroxybenzoate polyprenyltransferase